MTIDDELTDLRAQVEKVISSAQPDHQDMASNAITHLLRVFAYEGTAYITGIEALMTTLGNYLAIIDPNAGFELNKLGVMCAEGVDGSSVDAFLSERGIHPTIQPENNGIYEQFRSGHKDDDQVLKWLISE